MLVTPPNPIVNVDKVIARVLPAEIRSARLNVPGARSFRLHCDFPVAAGGRKAVLDVASASFCDLSVYRSPAPGGAAYRLGIRHLRVYVVERHAAWIGKDGHGWVTYSGTRSIRIDRIHQRELV
jgi:hypothetical protein